jgi:hypothetical protein
MKDFPKLFVRVRRKDLLTIPKNHLEKGNEK